MRNFLYNLQVKMQRFMQGRYGMDQLYRGLMYFTFGLILVNIFFRSAAINLLVYVLLGYNLFRALSKNYSKRYNENQKYLTFQNKVLKFYRTQKRHYDQRADYRFRYCPNCKQELRLPNKKGKHTVCCPKCQHEFKVKI